MILFLLIPLLAGCAHRSGPPKEFEIATTCLVKEDNPADSDGTTDHRVVCDDGTVVVLPRVVPVGSEVVYDSYYENEDSTTIHGYIKKIYEPVQAPTAD